MITLNMNTTTDNLPQHIGFIMDGNRRWARKRGLPAIEGHRKGYETVENVANWCFDRGVKRITLYTFSTENWKRSKNEVKDLIEFIQWVLKMDLRKFNEKDIRLTVIGQLKAFSRMLQQRIRKAVELTKHNQRGTIAIALNYGGREEIVEAVKQIVRSKIDPKKITEKTVSAHLYTKGVDDPELVIRTAGEKRLSNFLPWQSTYSELYFCNSFWPDFSEKDLEDALKDYADRKRRFGQ